MAQEQSNLRERSRQDIKEPKKFYVIIHNDDFTPMDFVVVILIHIFFVPAENAETLMLKVHHEGKTSLGPYSYDIAKSRINRATTTAREYGFPLRFSLKEA